MEKYRDLKHYLNVKWRDLIFSRSSNFIKNNVSNDEIATNRIPLPFARWLEEVEVTSVYTKAIKDNQIEIYASVRARLAFKGNEYGKRSNDVDTDVTDIYLQMVFSSIFIETFIDINVIHVCMLDQKKRFTINDSSSKAFIPYISEENLDVYATKFLQYVCPEAIEKPMPLPINTVLNKLGLISLSRELPKGVFGRTYFLENIYDNVSSGTIVFDPNKSFIQGLGSINNTIIHECVHWFFHKRFFDLMHLFNPEITSITCSTVEEDIVYPKVNSEDYKWMEWQANALAPRILMPTNTILEMFKNVYPSCLNNAQGNKLLALERTIDQLSRFFEVSKTSVKIRLLQLGVNNIAGINVYTNGEKISSHKTSNYKTNYNETFSLAFVDAVKLSYFNAQIAASLKDRTIVFVDGFFVLNDKKYIEKSIDNKRTLTQYAKENIEECCLLFTVKKRYIRKFDDRFYSLCFMSKVDQTDFLEASIDEQNEINKKVFEKSGSLKGVIDEEKEIRDFIYVHREDKFSLFFESLIKWSDFPNNNSEIGRATGLNEGTISNYRSGKTEPKELKTVLAICAGLHLVPDLSYALIRLCGLSIGGRGKEIDIAYKFLIENAYEYGRSFWNHHILTLGTTGDTIP